MQIIDMCKNQTNCLVVGEFIAPLFYMLQKFFLTRLHRYRQKNKRKNKNQKYKMAVSKFIIIKYCMEKVVAKKREKSQKIDSIKLTKNKQKKEKKIFENVKKSEFFLFLKLQKKTVIFTLMSFVLSCFFVCFGFLNNKYFLFLNRPKLLNSSNILCFFMLFCLFLNNFLLIFNKFLFFKKKRVCERNGNKINFIQKFSSSKLYYFVNILFLTISLSFVAKMLWLCVFQLFINFSVCFVLMFKQKSKKLQTLSIVEFLLSIMLLLSLYYIYLLN